ncbi:MAG: hypothetical protein KY468_04020 [Armatimonadetes bacterium]|nr:hypothetical protein [Armatimonadota bacterium]
MPPLGPGLSEDDVTRMVREWLKETHDLAAYPRYSLDLSEPLPETYDPAPLGIDIVAGKPGESPTWIIEAIGDLNNAPHYQVHFSGCLYTILTRTRPDDLEAGRRLCIAFPYWPEGKVPSPYVPALKRLQNTRFFSLGLEFLIAAPGPRITHLAGEELRAFIEGL